MGRRKTKQASPIKAIAVEENGSPGSPEGNRLIRDSIEKETIEIRGEGGTGDVAGNDGKSAGKQQETPCEELEEAGLGKSEEEDGGIVSTAMPNTGNRNVVYGLGHSANTSAARSSSWAALFKMNRVKSGDAQLRFIPPVVSDGVKVAKIHSSEVKEEAEKWKTVLVGSVIGAEPNFKRFERFAMSRWKNYGLISVQQLKLNTFLFQFDTEGGRDRVLKEGPFTFDQRPLILKPWKERLRLNEEELRHVPVWVKLPLLPLEYWGEATLSKIMSILGKPLFADLCTKDRLRLAYARILVEMDVLGEFPMEVHIEDEEGDVISQKVEYEWIPVACKECRCLGHLSSLCPRKGKEKQKWVPRAKDKKAEMGQGVSDPTVDSQGAMGVQGEQSGEESFTVVQSRKNGAVRSDLDGEGPLAFHDCRDGTGLTGQAKQSGITGSVHAYAPGIKGQANQRGKQKVGSEVGYPPDRGRCC